MHVGCRDKGCRHEAGDKRHGWRQDAELYTSGLHACRLEASGSLEGSVEGEGRVEAEAGMTANMRAESRSRRLEAEDSG